MSWRRESSNFMSEGAMTPNLQSSPSQSHESSSPTTSGHEMPEKISLALGGAKKPVPTNGVKRSHAALQEEDEEAPDEGRVQTVSHFDKTAGGAVDEANKKEDKPLSIAPQKNRNWKEASQRKRQRNGLPPGAQDGDANEQAIKELEDRKPQYGLNIAKRQDDAEEPIINGRDAQAEAEATQQQAPEPNAEASVKEKTDDERAMDALLGKTTKENLVVPQSEEEAFERDYNDAPEMATLDEYAAMPVDQFGAALLRGMGWKDGEGIGSNRGKKMEKTKMPERRPALLGIGAKEEAAVAQEMGTWGKAAKKGGEVKVYNPVLLRDKQTGEMYTEEELQKKKEKDERRKYEEEFDRKERAKESRWRRDDGEEDRSRDRGRREKENRRDRDRRRHDDSDEEYYRRKEKERRRRDRDRDDDYDRERSRRHDNDHHKHRDRRERDRDDDRDRRRR